MPNRGPPSFVNASSGLGSNCVASHAKVTVVPASVAVARRGPGSRAGRTSALSGGSGSHGAYIRNNVQVQGPLRDLPCISMFGRADSFPWPELVAIDERLPSPHAPSWLRAFALARSVYRGQAALTPAQELLREAPEAAQLALAWVGRKVDAGAARTLAQALEQQPPSELRAAAIAELRYYEEPAQVRERANRVARNQSVDVPALLAAGNKLNPKSTVKAVEKWLREVWLVPIADASPLVPHVERLLAHPSPNLKERFE